MSEHALTERATTALAETTGERTHGVWLLAFTDLVILILAFFAMLYALSTPRPDAPPAMPSTMNVIDDSVVAGHGVRALQPVAVRPDIAGLDNTYVRALLDQALTRPELAGVTVAVSGERLTLLLPPTLSFSPGDARLTGVTPRILDVLSDLAVLLERLPNEIAVVGYAVPTEVASGAAMWALSLRRAERAAAALRAAGYTRPVHVMGRGNGGHGGASTTGRRTETLVEIMIMAHRLEPELSEALPQ